jgi:O-antigen/teichoic acid export membrane protein
MKIIDYIKYLYAPGKNLGERAVKSGIWFLLIRIIERSFGLLRTIILARLLMPKDFGLFGVAMITIGTLQAFSQHGINIALIQKKSKITSYLNTAWTIGIIRGIILGIILIGIAPGVMKFFNTEKTIIYIMYTLGISLIIGNFRNIGMITYRKELDIGKRFIFSFATTMGDVITTIILALLFKNVWSLVGGYGARMVVSVIISYFLHPYRPKLEIDKQKIKELLEFGKWIFFSSILIFFITQGDDIFVGRFLGTTLLGFYVLAYHICRLPGNEFIAIIIKVALSFYSKIQNQLKRVKENYITTLQIINFILIPMMVGLIYLSEEFVLLFLGEKWSPIIKLIQVLGVWGIFHSVNQIAIPLFNGLGYPRLNTWINLIRLGILGGTIYPLGMRWGIIGVALAVMGSGVGVLPITMELIKKKIQLKKREIIKTLIPPIIGSGAMILGIKVGEIIMKKIDKIWEFILIVMIGIIIYYVVSLKLNFQTIQIIKEKIIKKGMGER